MSMGASAGLHRDMSTRRIQNKSRSKGSRRHMDDLDDLGAKVNDILGKLTDTSEDADSWLVAEAKGAVKRANAAVEDIELCERELQLGEAPSVEGVIAAVREGNFAEAAKRYAEAVAERRGLVPMQSPDPGGEDGTPDRESTKKLLASAAGRGYIWFVQKCRQVSQTYWFSFVVFACIMMATVMVTVEIEVCTVCFKHVAFTSSA